MDEKKESYVQPGIVKHELLRDITAKASGGHFARCLRYHHGHR